MSVVTVVTRIFPLTARPEDLNNLLKPTDLGKPIKVNNCLMVDPRTGSKFLIETTFCLGKTKDLGSLKVPGLVPLTSLDCALNNSEKHLGREFGFSIPKNIPFHEIPQLSNFTEFNESSNPSCKPSIKLHLNLKMIREATEKKNLIKKKEKRVRPLLQFFFDNECLICGLILNESEKSEVVCHMLSHTKLGRYACQKCKYKCFSSVEALYNHSIKHCSKKYSCNVCNFKCKRKFFLTLHYEKKHDSYIVNRRSSILKTSFVCTVCKVKLQSWKTLLAHKNAHFEKESYLCLFCYKTFSRDCRFLRYHSHLHFNTVNIKCRFCKKTFLSRNKLRDHERFHRVKLQHLCEYCGRKFNFSYSLSRHLQLHSQN